VLYFDLRGHGRSDDSSAEFWNLRTWADDLRRLCDALGLSQPVVLGSSFGGNVAAVRNHMMYGGREVTTRGGRDTAPHQAA
jgi:alpha-beta hydrolase superfamily lysophospholipase